MDGNKYILIRFNHELIHSTNLVNQGEIYFSKISDWTSNPERGDKYETIVSYKEIESGSILTIFKGDKEIKISVAKGQMVTKIEDIGYACSFYLLNLKNHKIDENFKLPTEMQKYGKTCVIIFNPEEFINLCRKHFESIGIPLFYQKVNYNLPINFNDKDIFTKHEDFAIEQEFRFYIPCEKIDKRIFSIGPIKSFSIVLEDYLSAVLKFAPTSLYPDANPSIIV